MSNIFSIEDVESINFDDYSSYFYLGEQSYSTNKIPLADLSDLFLETQLNAHKLMQECIYLFEKKNKSILLYGLNNFSFIHGSEIHYLLVRLLVVDKLFDRPDVLVIMDNYYKSFFYNKNGYKELKNKYTLKKILKIIYKIFTCLLFKTFTFKKNISNNICISFFDKRFITNDNFKDVYNGELINSSNSNIDYILSPTEINFSNNYSDFAKFRKIGRTGNHIFQYFSFVSLWKALPLFFRKINLPKIRHRRINLQYLFYKIFKQELSKNGGIESLFYYVFFTNIKAKHHINNLIYSYENHPWEKILNYIFAGHNNRMAITHATLPTLYPNYYLSYHENFLPKKILSNSEVFSKKLQSYFKNIDIINIGAWRYSYLWNNTKIEKEENLLVIMTPISQRLTLEILEKFIIAVNENKKLKEYKILVKCHPMQPCPSKLAKKLEKLNVFITNETTQFLLERSEALITAGSTVAIEAIANNVDTYIYLPNDVIEEPCYGLADDLITYINASELKKLSFKRNNRKITKQIFSKPKISTFNSIMDKSYELT